MKLLKIKSTGYRQLKDDFEVELFPKAKVTEFDLEDEIQEIRENLFYPTSIVFTGKNGGGKSTTLNLIEFAYTILKNGRVEYNPLDFKYDVINLQFYFLISETIYKYTVDINKPINHSLEKGNMYCRLLNEKLEKRIYSKSYGKNNLTKKFDIVTDYVSNIEDTSLLFNLKDKGDLLIRYELVDYSKGVESIFNINNVLRLEIETFNNLISIFDDSIVLLEYSKEDDKATVKFKNGIIQNLSAKRMNRVLSEGTKRGLYIYLLSILAFETGATMIVDEIENSLNKNLVENLIMLYNDKTVNKNNATLIFTTHYVEILDLFSRKDNIYVMSNSNGNIDICNVYQDYDIRTELKNSNLFNNNTFNTLINYEHIMSLKKRLKDEIHNLNRR